MGVPSLGMYLPHFWWLDFKIRFTARAYFQDFRLLFLAVSLSDRAWLGRERRRTWPWEKRVDYRQSQPAPSEYPCMRSLLQGLCLGTPWNPSPRESLLPVPLLWLWRLQYGDTNVESSETASRVHEDKVEPAPGSLETP